MGWASGMIQWNEPVEWACEIFSFRLSVVDFQFTHEPVGCACGLSLFDFQFLVFSFRFSVFGFQFLVFSFRLKLSNEPVGWSSGMSQWNEPVGFSVFGLQFLVFSFWFSVFDFQFTHEPVGCAYGMSLWDFQFLALSFWFSVSSFRFSVFSWASGMIQLNELVEWACLIFCFRFSVFDFQFSVFGFQFSIFSLLMSQ